jgi:hypothetical protein
MGAYENLLKLTALRKNRDIMGYVADNLKDLQKEFPNAMANPVCGAQCGSGWKEILRKVLAVYEARGARVAQIKEKFGGLRVYFDAPENGWTEEDAKACLVAEREAESASFKICEECEAPGEKGNHNGWMCTLCKPCFASIDERREKERVEYAAKRKVERESKEP